MLVYTYTPERLWGVKEKSILTRKLMFSLRKPYSLWLSLTRTRWKPVTCLRASPTHRKCPRGRREVNEAAQTPGQKTEDLTQKTVKEKCNFLMFGFLFPLVCVRDTNMVIINCYFLLHCCSFVFYIWVSMHWMSDILIYEHKDSRCLINIRSLNSSSKRDDGGGELCSRISLPL